MNIFKTVLWLTVVATYMLGCNGDGNFKFEKTIFETDADSTLVPSTIILSHQNDEIKSFKLEKPEGQPDDLLSYFELENDGVITKSGCNMIQVKPLDRETMSILRYKLNAYDSEGNYVTETTVTVWVQDINDEPPIVDEKTLRASVQEDVVIGKKFHKIIATDADVGFSYTGGDYEKNELKKQENVYNKMVYTKVEGTDPDDLIAVDADGNLSVNKNLDREKSNGQIKFQVKVRDWPTTTNPRQYYSSIHDVVIDVLDANDHAPVIVGGKTHQGSVVESASVGTSVLTFEATDADEGLNSEVTFMIVDGNEGGHFEVESVPRANGASKGTIVVNKPLDYEHGEKNFKLKIRAYNKDATNADAHKYQTEFDVMINVEDVNEAPVFKNTDSYQGNIMEGEPGQAVGSVVAVDEDEGQDFVSYNITNDPLNWFTISERGEISSKKPLDRENPAVIDGVYKIQISATDKEGATNYVYYDVIIGDKNDNAPEPVGEGWDVSMCHQYDEDQMISSITTLHVQDIDGPSNQGPFTFELYPDDKYFRLEYENDTTMAVVPALPAYEVDKVYKQQIIITDSGTPKQTFKAELIVRACSCGSDRIPNCQLAGYASSGSSVTWIIAVVVAMALVCIIVVALVYQRRRQAEDSKQLLYDEDDIREHINKVNIEGGGEEDNGDFDIGILNNPDYLVHEKPLNRADMYNLPEGTDVSKYINDAKEAADGDSGAPPFDSLLVFDFEGVGSEAGSLTSIGTGTTDGSHNYDYLHEWGPRFGKIADVYGNQSQQEEEN